MDTDSSDNNLVILTRRTRVKRFLGLFWKTVIIVTAPFILLPVYFITENNAPSYIFIITMVYWITDVMHPGITALVPMTLYTLIGSDVYLNMMLPVGSELFDCLSVMLIVVAIEYCNLNRRIAVKLLITVGCSHFRLSFMLFFSTMFLSMWLTDIIACGFMMPLLKAILMELERMGILEMHHTVTKKLRTDPYEQGNPKPTEFTVFYFLGIAYSASIGSMATIMGSQSNQIFKMYCESLFPLSPKIEFPHMSLLNLPGVLLMEGLLYVWMNIYFLGMFRGRTDISLEIGISEEEAQYIRALLTMQYQQLGRINFHESIVGVIVLLACIFQTSFGFHFQQNHPLNPSELKASAPSMICVIILFITPVSVEFIKFFKRRRSCAASLPITNSKSCLNWKLVQDNVNWSVLFVIVGSSSAFSSLTQPWFLRDAATSKDWPAPVLALLVILLCKLLGETASNATVAHCILPSIARLSVASSVNPHYLMLAATLACSLPFHLITGSPVNAMVAAYVHIPAWKMMTAGIGPSVIAVVVTWFTVAVWSKTIWTDIHLNPPWAAQIANITL